MTDWLDLLAVQGTLKGLLQHHSSKASVLQHSAFFIVQHSHPYMATRKTIALTRWTFVGKVRYQFSWVTQLCLTLCDLMDCSMPGFPVHHQLPELAQTHVHWVGDAVQPSHPLSSTLFLPSIFPSIRVFSNESVLRIRWPKSWSFSFSISPSNDYSGWISFRIDSFDLLAVQGTLKSLLQHHSSKPSILQCSPYAMVQLSHP